MRRTRFNEGWAVRPKASLFFDMFGTGSPWTEVTLPHDAMISPVDPALAFRVEVLR